MTREEIIKSMSLQDAIQAFKNTNCYGTMDIAKSVILKALEQEPVIDKIRADIIMYEGDCRLSVDEYPSCKQCTDNVFETIYGIFDKYRGEIEDK